MLEGINNSGIQAMGMHMHMGNEKVQLTDDQKTQLQSILSKYDPAQMSEDSKKSLMEELKSSGIAPSHEVRSIIEDAGFDLKPPQNGPPPSGGKAGMSAQKPDFIQDAINKYESDELSEQDIETLIAKLKEWGEPPQGIIFNQTT